uniref:Uncharacterized protein n=1 Tax=Trichuris muris TaxID=70415 RepID=A0A5S6PYM0_TRIMR
MCHCLSHRESGQRHSPKNNAKIERQLRATNGRKWPKVGDYCHANQAQFDLQTCANGPRPSAKSSRLTPVGKVYCEALANPADSPTRLLAMRLENEKCQHEDNGPAPLGRLENCITFPIGRSAATNASRAVHALLAALTKLRVVSSKLQYAREAMPSKVGHTKARLRKTN